jgi:trans-aconitate methyltransferase
MLTDNIAYRSDTIANHYQSSRICWDQFYPSERHVIEQINPTPDCRVLDMGCACGGLGLALKERFGISNYTGIDINPQAIAQAHTMHPDGTFICADFLTIADSYTDSADLAFSLSCADWNVHTTPLLRALLNTVRVGGKMVFSCRLTNQPDLQEPLQGRQAVVFDSTTQATEFAPYKVYSLSQIQRIFRQLGPLSDVYGFGYWGDIPGTVRDLPLSRAFYVVFSLTKAAQSQTTRVVLNFTDDFF